MRICLATLVMIGLCIGCSAADHSQVEDNNINVQQIGGDNKNQDEQLSSTFTHVIAAETEYYTTGPQQGRSPDGKFPSGTRVNIVEEAGSYILVRSEGGVEAFVTADVVKQQENTAMDVSGIVDGGNRFALDLYQQLRTEDGNLFFSPSSISIALSMARAGAAGKTKAEMAKTLHLQMPEDQLNQGMKSLQSKWITPDEKKGIRLDLASRLWSQESYQFLPTFLGITREMYGAELARLNFAQAEQSRQTINGWVADHTQDKITDLIPPGAINSGTKLVLTNAVYFKGIWTDPFKKERTKEEDFHLAASAIIKVPMMRRMDEYRYGEAADLQILELPYGDGSLSMVVLLPKEIDGLADLEAKLTFQNLQKWLGLSSKRDVRIYLPKFETTSKFEMNEALRTMGMTSAFDANSADFSGMTGDKDLFISTVIHKAFVDVNEEGTEAAAATGVIMAPASAAPNSTEPPVFRADHPFVFMIRDNRNGSIVFMGRIRNPSE